MPDLWLDVDTALAEVPVNILPLLDDTDFKTREETIAYNAAGLELIWHFTTTAGATTATVVTPTTAGVYDWGHQDGGMYTIEIPASGGISINNDTEGFGWFTGVADGVLPWRGPIIGFRAAGLNNALVDSAYSATRGLAGTALPAAAADAAGGLPISDAGGLDLDAILADTNELQGDWVNGGRLDLLIDAILADTGELQADWVNGGRLDLLIDAILADTGELQADWANGGRLDLLIDAILADTGTDGVVIATATAQAIADEILSRSVSNVEDTAGNHSLAELILGAFESALSGTTWTIKKTDGSTTFNTRTVTTDANADPVTAVT
jgi:hypothetical protein